MIYHNNRIQLNKIELKVDTVIYTSVYTELTFSFGETKLDQTNQTWFPEYGEVELFYIYFKRNRTSLNSCQIVSRPVYVYKNGRVELPSEEKDSEHFKIAIAKRDGTIDFLYPHKSSGTIILESQDVIPPNPISTVTPPSSLIYNSGNDAVVEGNSKISYIPAINAGNSSSQITYSITPNLPTGLSLNPNSGEISGTLPAVSSDVTYIITAKNTSGSTKSGFRIVTFVKIPPSKLSYNGDLVATAFGLSYILYAPSIDIGNSPTKIKYNISPQLPVGLDFNVENGEISGITPNVNFDSIYTITASNDYGSVSDDFQLSIVQRIPPSNLQYNAGMVASIKSLSSISFAPSINAGNSPAPLQYSISPSLPSGMSLDLNSGIISGTTPSVNSDLTYTITASNEFGTTSTQFRINIFIPIPPSNLVYNSGQTGNAFVSTVVSYTPSINLGNSPDPITYSITPALPSGLSINQNTGVISGTTPSTTSDTSHVITAKNDYGSVSANFRINVGLKVPPTSLVYNNGLQASPFVSTLVSYKPTISAGNGTTAIVYSISPALPSGLILNTSTGEISGTTPSTASDVIYTVTATNNYGSTSYQFSIKISLKTPPSNLVYNSGQTANILTGSTSTYSPSISVGTSQNQITYSINPPLPVDEKSGIGLSIDSKTGIISGTAPSMASDVIYTITASNDIGSTTCQFRLNIYEPIPPSKLFYNEGMDGSFLTNTKVYLEPSISAGNSQVALTYTITPSLPVDAKSGIGLSLDFKTGVISGTAPSMASDIIYTIVASNDFGSTSYQFRLNIYEPVPPSKLVYNGGSTASVQASSPFSYIPVISAGNCPNPLTFTITPSLPSGLSINATTGEISGTTPSVESDITYTITARNDFGSTSSSFRVTITMPEEICTTLVWETYPTIVDAINGYIKGDIYEVNLINNSTGSSELKYYESNIISASLLNPPMSVSGDTPDSGLKLNEITPGITRNVSGIKVALGDRTINFPNFQFTPLYSYLSVMNGIGDSNNSAYYGMGVIKNIEVYDINGVFLKNLDVVVMYELYCLKFPEFKSDKFTYNGYTRRVTIGIDTLKFADVMGGKIAPEWVNCSVIDGRMIGIITPQEMVNAWQSGKGIITIRKNGSGFEVFLETANMLQLGYGNYAFNYSFHRTPVNIDGANRVIYWNYNLQHVGKTTLDNYTKTYKKIVVA